MELKRKGGIDVQVAMKSNNCGTLTRSYTRPDSMISYRPALVLLLAGVWCYVLGVCVVLLARPNTLEVFRDLVGPVPVSKRVNDVI